MVFNGWFIHIDSIDYLLRIAESIGNRNKKKRSKVACIGCQEVHDQLLIRDRVSFHRDDALPMSWIQSFERHDFIIVDTHLALPSFTDFLRLPDLNSKICHVIVLACYYQQHCLSGHNESWRMLDYRVAYTNEMTYPYRVETPVRIFTTIPLPLVPSPQEAGYTMCLDCNMWIFYDTMSHCSECHKCSSFDGIWCPHVGPKRKSVRFLLPPTTVEDDIKAIIASERDDPMAVTKVLALIAFLKRGFLEKAELAGR